MEQILSEAIPKLMKGKKGIGSSSHGFAEVKSCLSNLIAFCEEVTGTVGKGRGTGWGVPWF